MYKNIFLFCFILSQFYNSQYIITKGVPYVESFNNFNNQKTTHIWDIDEAPNHIMYFVNEQGLLEFDGENWKTFSGSVGITRSLKIVSNELIFTGSDHDFGVWKKNTKNQFKYKSLYPNKGKKNVPVEEFWNTFYIKGIVIFQSFNNLYCYENNQFTKVQAPSRFMSGYQSKDEIFLVDEKYGIFSYDGFTLKPLPIVLQFANDQIVAVDKINEKIIIVTKKNGVYTYVGNQLIPLIQLNGQISESEIFSYKKINSQYIAFGTIDKGLIISDLQGNIIHRLNKINGLLNNTILSLHYSDYGKLWLGLDFGINVLYLNSPYSFNIDYKGEIGTVYTSVLENDVLYLGTNQGIYHLPFSKLSNSFYNLPYQIIPNSKGQVWYLTKIGDKIFCGHNKGLFELKNNNLLPIDTKPGVWSIIEIAGYIVTGNYNGIHIYKNNNGNVSYYKSLKDVYGSCNQIVNYKNKLFVNLPKEGVLEMKIDSNFNIISKNIYKISLFQNAPFQIEVKNDKLVINTANFEYSKNLNPSKNIFLKKKKNTAYILDNQLLKYFFQPTILNNSYNLYSIYNGFVIHDKNIKVQLPYKTIPNPIIRNSFYFNDKTMVFQNGEKLSYKNNNIRIQYIIPNTMHDIEYQYKLEGLNNNWSKWSKKNSADFINLKDGKYNFIVKAKFDGKISKETSFSFEIKPPFYRSFWMKFIYFISIIVLIYVLYKWHVTRLKKETKKMLKIQRKTLNEQSRKYQEKLFLEKQEKLELEKLSLTKTIENKELELAKKIIDQQEINDMIISIKNKIEDTQKNATQKMSIKNYSELITFIEKKINTEISKEYEIAFDNSQARFHEKLLLKHPNLSPTDLHIASYLQMNLSSKEIAKIMQVLPSSIDVNRSRLRKKLELDDTIKLRDYLNTFN